MPRRHAVRFALAFAVATASPALAADPPAVAPPRVGGYVQVREMVQSEVGLTSVLNRVRTSLEGTPGSGFTYRLLVEYEASAGARSAATTSLREAYIRWTRGPWALQGGQFKAPFTREYLIPVPQLETADLAVVIDSIAPKYDVGVMGEWQPGLGARCRWASSTARARTPRRIVTRP